MREKIFSSFWPNKKSRNCIKYICQKRGAFWKFAIIGSLRTNYIVHSPKPFCEWSWNFFFLLSLSISQMSSSVSNSLACQCWALVLCSSNWHSQPIANFSLFFGRDHFAQYPITLSLSESYKLVEDKIHYLLLVAVFGLQDSSLITVTVQLISV